MEVERARWSNLFKRLEKKITQWPDESQFEFLAQALWPHYTYGKNAVYQSGHHGNAILSKYPFISRENIKLTNFTRASRSMLHASTDAPGTLLHLLCIHLGLFKTERREQAQALVERVQETIPSDAPLLMAGDFNDWRKDLDDLIESQLSISEAHKVATGSYAKTFPALKPTLPIDRIYFRGMTLEEVKCLDTMPWRLLSDHLPLYARFSID